MIQVKDVKLVNLQDGARLCVGAKTPPNLDKEAVLDLHRSKLAFYQQRTAAGAGAKAAYRDGLLVASVDWYPLELAPLPVEGKDLFAVNCIRVGDRAARTEILTEIFRVAEPAWQKRAGVVAVTRKKSLAEFGWEEIDRMRPPEREGDDLVLYLRKFKPEATASFLKPTRDLSPAAGKVRLDLFLSTHCPWDGYVFDLVRRVAQSYRERPLELHEWDCNRRENVVKYGVAAGVAINGVFQPLLRPHRLPEERSVRRLFEEA